MTSDNLPAVRPAAEIRRQDTDSWIGVVENIAALATKIADTEFVPRGLRGSAAATAAAILYGREVGLPPMTALTQTHVIEGKPAVSAEAMRAMILAAGHQIRVTESTGAKCVMIGRRAGDEEWSAPVEWTIDLARQAGLTTKANWKGYPRQMLQARCTAELARLVFPDVIHGFRAVEELDQDQEDLPGEGLSRAVGGSTTVRRKGKSTGTRGEAIAEKAPARPVLDGPPLPGEEGYELAGSAASEPGGEPGDPVKAAESATTDGDNPSPAGEGPESAPVPSPATDVAEGDAAAPASSRDDAPPPRPITKAQLKMLHVSFGEKDLGGEANRDKRLELVSRIVQRDVQSTAHMNTREASGVIDTLARVGSIEELERILDELDQDPGPVPEDEPA